jgi:predicted Fe-Mo cluster-binding NifX family protein
MGIKVAIASTDGKVVNEHFGRATKFHVFELNPNGFKFLETRPVERCCNGGEHEDSAFEKVAHTLNDCKAIFVAKIGLGASNYMESKGFIIFESPYVIEDVLNKVLQDNLLEVD